MVGESARGAEEMDDIKPSGQKLRLVFALLY